VDVGWVERSNVIVVELEPKEVRDVGVGWENVNTSSSWAICEKLKVTFFQEDKLL